MASILVVSGLCLLVAGLLTVALTRDRRRGAAFERAGQRMSLRYEHRSTGLSKMLSGIPSIASALHQRFQHVLRSEDELLCDWTTLRPLERRRRARHQTLVALRLEDARWPSFRIAPRSL